MRKQYSRARLRIPPGARIERIAEDRHLESAKLPYRFQRVYYAINTGSIDPFGYLQTEARDEAKWIPHFHPCADVSTWKNDNESSPFRDALMWRGWESFLINWHEEVVGAFLKQATHRSHQYLFECVYLSTITVYVFVVRILVIWTEMKLYKHTLFVNS